VFDNLFSFTKLVIITYYLFLFVFVQKLFNQIIRKYQ